MTPTREGAPVTKRPRSDNETVPATSDLVARAVDEARKLVDFDENFERGIETSGLPSWGGDYICSAGRHLRDALRRVLTLKACQDLDNASRQLLEQAEHRLFLRLAWHRIILRQSLERYIKAKTIPPQAEPSTDTIRKAAAPSSARVPLRARSRVRQPRSRPVRRSRSRSRSPDDDAAPARGRLATTFVRRSFEGRRP